MYIVKRCDKNGRVIFFEESISGKLKRVSYRSIQMAIQNGSPVAIKLI